MVSLSAVLERSRDREAAFFALTVAVFAIALVFGGATIQGLASDAVAELAALPLLAMALVRLATAPVHRLRRAAFPLILLAVLLLMPLIQLVPLPPAIWTALPGRNIAVETFDFIGKSLPWWPISLDPAATLRSFLSVLPAVAVFLAVLTVDLRDRRILTLMLVGFAVLTVILGLAQLAQGQGSPLRFYAITNLDSSVGFFANRNHYAAFLCAVLPLVLAWTVHFAGKSRSEGRLRSIGFALCAVLLLLGAAMSLSRAGILLATLSFGSGILLLDFRAAHDSRKSAGRLMAVIGVIALIMIAHYALSGLLLRFTSADADDFRFTIWSITGDAVWSVFPVGGGFGTFQPLYRLFDRPEALTNAFVNRAHNDWLELVLEAGAAAVAAMVAFLTWFVLQAVRVWRRETTTDTRLDVTLARAATISVVLILAHSVVDYPLRTIAAQATFAFLCALLVAPVRQVEPPVRRRRRSSSSGRSGSGGGPRSGGGGPPRSRPVPPPPPRRPTDRPSLNWTD